MKPTFLATTALPEFWDPQQEIFFLGPWCRRPDRRQDWEGLSGSILASPWEDRERFHAAADYLDRRMEEVLPPLADTLNAQLGYSGDLRYWRILIGTWLMHSLHVTYDRYVHLSEALRNAPDLQTLLLDTASFRTPEDTLQAVEWMMSDDLYNLQIFSQVLAGMGCSFPAKRPSPNGARRRAAPEGARQRLRGVLQGTRAGLWQLLASRAGTRLVEMHCPDSVQLRLCWESRFGAAPWALPSKEETTSSSAPDPRRSALSNLPAADEFMRLWVRSLPENFPALYLEGFKAARERALKRLRNPPRALVSATGWHYSEPFKFLAAELPQLGGHLVAVQHGSGYGLFRSMPMELHERRVSDVFLGWNEAPALQLAPLRTASGRRAPSRSRRLLFVATTNPRYLFRFYSAPQAHPLERYFEWQTRFLECVGASLRERIVVRLHPRDFGHCLPQRLEERLGRLRWDRQRSFIESAKKSGLLVVDHPGTSMLAALGGNFPTLLFWDPGLWEFRPEAGPHLESLRQAGLFQESPESAARALEQILQEGPDRWWNRSSVQRARWQFVERYVPLPADWLRRWSERLPR